MTLSSAFNIQTEALQQFEKVVSRAFWRNMLRLGKNMDLASFPQDSQSHTTGARSARGVQLICVDQIVGSVSENHSFDDEFNPRRFDSKERWVRLYIGFVKGHPIPPIDVYKMGDVYYVEDGHHRVSVARVLGVSLIDANIIEIEVNCCAA